MRYFLLIAACAGFAGAQSIAENAAAAAGGSAGGAAGKHTGEGLSAIFNKVDKQTAKAANSGASSKSTPLLEVGPGVPKNELVPPPPPAPVHRTSSAHRIPKAHQEMEPALTPAAYSAPVYSIPNIPPPPDIKASDLQGLKPGTERSTLLSLGTPSERITSFEDDHLIEVFRFMSGDRSLGVVQLTDGKVSSVTLN